MAPAPKRAGLVECDSGPLTVHQVSPFGSRYHKVRNTEQGTCLVGLAPFFLDRCSHPSAKWLLVQVGEGQYQIAAALTEDKHVCMAPQRIGSGALVAGMMPCNKADANQLWKFVPVT